MPRYRFRVRNHRNKLVRGVLVADTESQARQQLLDHKYTIETVTEARDLLSRIDYALARARKPSAFELSVTTRQLAVMLESGVAIVRAMQVLTEQPLSSKVFDAWASVRTDINMGLSLSRAMAKQHEVFPTLYVGMVRAGETTGQLYNALSYVADHLDKELTLRRKVQAALSYPAVIFAVCAALCVLIVQHILPQFVNGLFRNSGMDLPWMTRSLIVVTDFFADPRALGTTAVFLALAVWMGKNYLRTPAGKHRWQEVSLKLPVLRDVTSKVLAARFARTMSTLVNTGIPIMHSLELTGSALGNYVLADRLENARGILKDGGKLADGMRDIKFFPPMLTSFVDLGEQTGRLGPLLRKTGEVYEQELDLALETYTALLEPLMVAVMGLLVGYVLVAVFVPLYRILGNF